MPAQRNRVQLVLLGVAIVAGVLALLAPLLVFLPIYDPSNAMEGAGSTTASRAGKLGLALAALAPAAALGVVGLAGARLLWHGVAAGRALLMAAALALLVLTIFTAPTVGPYLFAPALLFVFPALWLQYQPGQGGPPA
ncbi:MAG: hypothetical protein V3V35_08490 [Dehalococcoidia bacterium]